MDRKTTILIILVLASSLTATYAIQTGLDSKIKDLESKLSQETEKRAALDTKIKNIVDMQVYMAEKLLAQLETLTSGLESVQNAVTSISEKSEATASITLLREEIRALKDAVISLKLDSGEQEALMKNMTATIDDLECEVDKQARSVGVFHPKVIVTPRRESFQNGTTLIFNISAERRVNATIRVYSPDGKLRWTSSIGEGWVRVGAGWVMPYAYQLAEGNPMIFQDQEAAGEWRYTVEVQLGTTEAPRINGSIQGVFYVANEPREEIFHVEGVKID